MTLLIPSLLTLLAAVPDAHAADFSGRVRRIRIRENNNDSNFRTIVQTESSDASDPGSVGITITGLETGEQATPTTTAKKTRVLATATASFSRVRPIETKYTMTAQMRGVADPTLVYDWVVELDRCQADCPWFEEILDDGTVAGVKLTVTEEADGTESVAAELRLVPQDHMIWTFSHDQRIAVDDADGDGVPDETVDADLGEGPVYRTRWASTRWSTPDAALQIEATLTNPDGTVDSLSDFAVLDLGGETGLVEASIKPRKRGGYKVNLWTQATADAPVGSVFAEVSDADSDEVLAELDLDAPVETTAILSSALPATLLEGEKVAATVTLYAGAETLLSTSLSFVLAEGLLDASFTDDGIVALHKAGLYVADDGTYELAFSVTGTDAELVTGAVIDVSTRTTLDSVDGAVESVWQRWTGVVDTDTTPESFSFDTEVRDGDGVGVDGWAFDIQAQFGTGTRSTAGQANNKAELL